MHPDTTPTDSPTGRSDDSGLGATVAERLTAWLNSPPNRPDDPTSRLIAAAAAEIRHLTADLELAELALHAMRSELATAHPVVGGMTAARRVAGVIGITEAAAVATLTDAGFDQRVVSRDGIGQIVTADYRPDRVNLVISRGTVTDAHLG